MLNRSEALISSRFYSVHPRVILSKADYNISCYTLLQQACSIILLYDIYSVISLGIVDNIFWISHMYGSNWSWLYELKIKMHANIPGEPVN